MGILDFLKLKATVVPVELSSETFFPSINNSPLPVLVDFYSNTCTPCKQMAKTVTKFATDCQGRVRVGAFNVASDEEGKILGEFGIRGVPTLIFFHKGEVKEVFSGLVGYLVLEEALKKIESENQ